ncbi:hypothetical protein [Qipengyuania soli]|uniref:DUF4235 domain-containing protein n=1 Tax=Qipengyuania soli TaxID=2782568 RepID=A0A7S8F4Q5_9SPHN|nr:hypothetical protein [Qipengyuania soli]QPC99096.1 hypothetical protein IRL76_00445 [Qipengyuania soli]
MAKRKNRKPTTKGAKVPGPTENPLTNLMLADVAIRAGSYIVRRTVEKGFLRGRYGKEAARDIIQNKTLGQTVVSFGLARLATRNLPGAIIVGGGALAKTLYDRRKSKRKQQAEGDAQLIEQAQSEE